jgi:hypothetical protein
MTQFVRRFKDGVVMLVCGVAGIIVLVLLFITPKSWLGMDKWETIDLS